MLHSKLWDLSYSQRNEVLICRDAISILARLHTCSLLLLDPMRLMDMMWGCLFWLTGNRNAAALASRQTQASIRTAEA